MKNALHLFLLSFFVALAASAQLTREDLLVAIRQDLANHYTAEGEWSVELVRELAIPATADRVQVAAFPSRPTAAMILRLQFFGEDAKLLDTNVSVRAHLWRDAWIAGQPLTRGQSVDSSQLDLQRVDLLRETNAVPASATDEGDFIYARSIPAGRVLNWRDLQRRPIVQRGQIVEVAAVDGGLSIVLKAMALESGALGELIRVRNLQSQREIAALIVSEGRAEISF